MTKYSLMKEASVNARKAGERGVSAKNVKKVTEVRLDFDPEQTQANIGIAHASQVQGIMELRPWC